ncbi:hypothetical protein SERLA73DRAFT_157278 [Serpula lacrymans var. lacrymans S7.3]|uniref:DUF4939 domain-containing protein n=1 Tax=Serpula lacrymans var. lacrymans (strain S7.3) TaxID=936435 RepID=F8QI92_SERL3|nr:hypothetical protein SERLA73DRAFT_157278 [Serpula lacrymans var. lacrymans S7.3]
MTDSMLDLAEALPAVGPSWTFTPPQLPTGINPEIQEWMQRMLEAEVARRVTEATKKEREGRMRAHQAAERAEQEAAEYRGLWERQITTNSDTQKNDSGGEKKDHRRLRSALDSPPTFNGDQMKFRNFMEHLSLHFKEDPAYFGDEKKKIAFVLSYMKEGTAASFRSKC